MWPPGRAACCKVAPTALAQTCCVPFNTWTHTSFLSGNNFQIISVTRVCIPKVSLFSQSCSHKCGHFLELSGITTAGAIHTKKGNFPNPPFPHFLFQNSLCKGIPWGQIFIALSKASIWAIHRLYVVCHFFFYIKRKFFQTPLSTLSFSKLFLPGYSFLQSRVKFLLGM